MIRVYKHPTSPSSLLKVGNTEYNHQDVQRQLLNDQHGKCYLCERICNTDYQIEHLKSVHHHSHLKCEWSNLFLSCSYCNGKKLENFDDILDPSMQNVENLIVCKHDISQKRVDFTTTEPETTEIKKTIQLLEKIFNGNAKVRKVKEEQFYNQFLLSMNRFLSLVTDFLRDNSTSKEQAIREELQVGKEFLAFKYHLLLDNNQTANIFKADLNWNKI